VVQYACRYCGDCWSGCNVGAKNTVAITYIADAVHHGATAFCESRAQSIRKTERGWKILVQDRRRVQAGVSRRRSSSWQRAHWVPRSCFCGRSSVVSSSRRSWVRISRRTVTTSYLPTNSRSPSMPLPRDFRLRRHGEPRRLGPTVWH
jgi:ferredoxin